MGKGDYAEADRYFNRALEFTPKYAYLHINLGILNAAAGRTKEAEEHFRNALDFNPNFPGSYSYYAKFLVGQKRFDEAIDLAEKALKLSSADLDVRHLLLDMYLEKLDAEKLTAFASETLQIAPDDQKALLYLNAARKGRQGLQFIWEKTKAPTPKTAVDFLNLSLHYYNAKEYEKSIEAAKEALKRKPDFDLAYNNLCVSYNRLNKWDLAIEAGEKAVKLNPNNQLARNNLAWARNGKAGKAGVDLERKENLPAAKTPEGLLNLSLLYYNAKEYEKSLEAAKAALKLRPGYSEAYNNICAANNSLQRWAPAIEACEKALKINPDNQLARNNLAWAKKQSSTRN
jgi:tetratricopeptide (TPR) repeat protein